MLNQDIAVWKCFKQISGFQTESCLDISLSITNSGSFRSEWKWIQFSSTLISNAKILYSESFRLLQYVYHRDCTLNSSSRHTTSPVIRPVFSHEVKIRTRSLHLRDSSLIPKFKLWPDLSLSFNIHTIIWTNIWWELLLISNQSLKCRKFDIP